MWNNTVLPEVALHDIKNLLEILYQFDTILIAAKVVHFL